MLTFHNSECRDLNFFLLSPLCWAGSIVSNKSFEHMIYNASNRYILEFLIINIKSYCSRNEVNFAKHDT